MENTGQLSRRKNQKVPIGERNEPSDDRLSSLPDPIICHILSFLPTKISVATSILGKRWRFLWTGVPCILLNSEDYKEEYGPPFSVIINGVLLLNNVQTMDTFRLFTVDYTEDMECHIETWIATLIARRIQNIELHFDSVYDCFPLNPVVLPRCLFTCETLVDLRLHGCGVTYPLPAKLCFPSLKKLDLCFVEYNGDSNLTDLISSCPVLEELFIDHFLEKGYFHCNIHSPTIKCLKVVFQLNDDREDDIFEPREYGLAINAPALRYLHVENAFSEYISAHMLTSLIEADIHLVDGWVDADIRRMNGMVDDIEYAESHSNLVEYFVNELCNVKCLKLSIHYVKDLKVTDSAFSFSTRKFNNLTKLELEADWHFLSMFLEIADNLEVLVIHKADFLRRWMEPQQVPTCLLSHLTNITIHLFQYVEYDFEMVRYLLMNAQVLKNMEIYSSHSHHVPAEVGKWKSWALERISEFERGSEECKLVFH